MTTDPPARRPLSFLKVADLRGLARLGIDGVVGVTDLVESMHLTIASRSGVVEPGPAGKTSGVTGLVYRAVRGTTRGVGKGLDVVLAAVPRAAGNPSPLREAFITALNGVWSDHLAATGNPVAIAMSLRIGGHPY